MPAVEWISVAGFRSIANIERLPLGRLNVLIGPNGSGKSNFIELFPFLDAVWNDDLDNYVHRQGGAERILHYGAKTTRKIAVSISFNDGNEYRIEIEPDGRDRLRLNGIDVVRERANPAADASDVRQPPYLPNRAQHAETAIETDRTDTDCNRTKFPGWRVYRTDTTSPMKQAADIADHLYLRSDGSNIAAYLYFLRNEHETRYNCIRRVIQFTLPFFEDFHLEPQAPDKNTISLAWRDRKSGSCFDASYLSDGTLRFMALATLLNQPESLRPAVIVLDEPELSRPPHGKALLASSLRSASHNSQIVLATQSGRLVDEFEPENLIVADRVGGATKFTRPDLKDLAERLTEFTLGELWEKNEFGGRSASRYDERPFKL